MIIILTLHIIVALSGLVFTGLAFLHPSKPKLRVAYSLVALTLASGFYLVFTNPAGLTETCVTGLAYLALISFGIALARKKLAGQKIK